MRQVVLVQDYNVAHEILVAEHAEKGFDPVKLLLLARNFGTCSDRS